MPIEQEPDGVIADMQAGFALTGEQTFKLAVLYAGMVQEMTLANNQLIMRLMEMPLPVSVTDELHNWSAHISRLHEELVARAEAVRSPPVMN